MNASLEETKFRIMTIRVHRLFISHIRRSKLLMLEYYLSELLGRLELMLVQFLLLINRLRKHT